MDSVILDQMIARLAQGCELPKRHLESIQEGTLRYTYKGIPTWKNQFDLALYQLLLWEQRPRTLIEIGSAWGGSALWFADILRTYGIDCGIHSVDVRPPDKVIAGARFYRGDGRDLTKTLTPQLMAELPRPLLVIEDANHRSETTLAVLRFFDQWLKVGEYIVIEDGIVDDLFDTERMAPFAGGPRLGIAQFLCERGAEYEIDTRFCDYFGTNLTWNVNGYLPGAHATSLRVLSLPCASGVLGSAEPARTEARFRMDAGRGRKRRSNGSSRCPPCMWTRPLCGSIRRTSGSMSARAGRSP